MPGKFPEADGTSIMGITTHPDLHRQRADPH